MRCLVTSALVVASALVARPAAAPPAQPGDPGASAPPPSSAPARRPRLIAPPGDLVPDGRKQRGVALGLFAEDVSFSYGPLLAEIAALGATHVALVVPVYQENGASTELSLHTRLSPSLDTTAEAIRAARRAGLEVTLFPIVRLSAPRPGEWRGTLAPSDRAAWFAAYGRVLGDLGAIATLTGATRLVVGSELSSLDTDLAHWTPLIDRIRGVFPGPLVYSANWDHYREARLFDLVDEAGVTAYFELRKKDGPGDVAALVEGWRRTRAELEAWRAARKQPFVFTEVGYRSRAGSSATPWDETGGGTVDLEEQRRAFEAFRRAWTTDPRPQLDGLYVWNWYGFGGPQSRGYTPRGKPAASEVKRLLEEL